MFDIETVLQMLGEEDRYSDPWTPMQDDPLRIEESLGWADDPQPSVPASLATMDPGVELAAFLSAIDVEGLSGHDRVTVLRAHQRMASHYQAKLYADMASVADAMDDMEDVELATDAAAAEIRAALRLTRRAAGSELEFALQLRRRLPRLWELLASGDIDVRRARTISHGTEHLTAGQARSLVDQLIDRAPQLTTGQLAALVRRMSIEVDPNAATERYRNAVSERRVTVQPSPDGTADLLGLDMPPDRVQAAAAHINALARSLRSSNEHRTMDQLRADVFLDLLSGASHGRRGGTVDIRVDLETLARLSEAPGDLAGYGPVVADIARQVADDHHRGEWRFAITDAGSGQLIGGGTTRRRPVREQRRQVEMIDPTCIFPGCRMPATDCDLDHRLPHADGGQTIESNLTPLCRADHVLRHGAGWSHEPLPNGDHVWTTRLQHRYTTSGAPP